MSPSRLSARARAAVVAALVTAAAGVAGEAAAGTGPEQLAPRWTPSTAWGRAVGSLRLDGGSRHGLPMLAAYAHPATPSWTYAWRASQRPWTCTGWGFEGYGWAKSLSQWKPSGAWQGASLVPTCDSVPAEGRWSWSSARAEGGGAAWVGAAMAPGSPMAWELPRPGSGQAWFSAPMAGGQACARKAVSFVRYAAETDRFPLLECDGSVDGDALDHLSVMARPIGADRPELPLPDEPESGSAHGEWVKSVKLVHPRLVWLVQQIADAFPGRSIYIVSGYRTGAHEGAHGDARALDLSVMGVAKERVYKVCRSLRDVGCGYYPNHNFAHVDVRPPGSGGSYWIDISEPGGKSEYVSSWPGVEDGAAGRWAIGDR